MRTTLKLVIISLAVPAWLFCLACKKFLDIDRPVNQLVSGSVFSDSTSAEAAAVGVYAGIMENFLKTLNGRITLNAGLAADELNTPATNAGPNPFATNNLLADNSANTATWTEAYKLIYHINSVLQQVEASQSLPTRMKGRISVEMTVMRALTYYFLLSLYGDIPYTTGTDFRINGILARKSAAAVSSTLFTELESAAAYFKSAGLPESKFRVGRWATEGLLARMALLRKDWLAAVQHASEVISSGQFSMPALAAAFTAKSPEVILQFMPSTVLPYGSGEGNAFIPSSASVVPTYYLTPELLATFEPGDQRRTQWVLQQNATGGPYYYPAKYRVRQNPVYTVKEECQVALRLGELLLLRAEALAELGRLPEAISDLDLVRKRAGLPLLVTTNPGISKEALLTAIYHERQIELFAEWGHRWLDLKRTGRINTVLAMVKGGDWQATDALFPIPQSEILANPNLTQNEGY